MDSRCESGPHRVDGKRRILYRELTRIIHVGWVKFA